MKTSLVGQMFGHYEIRRMLGKGGMGEVYEAFDTVKGRTVALKILSERFADDENFRTRFLRESRAAAVLQEPHVIPIHDWGEVGNALYIDMRLVQGQTLYDMLQAGPLEPQRAVEIIAQIAAALDAAHAEGLIHRDVKPQNIIVTPTDFAYLVDFGIVEAQGDTRLTQAGAAIGSWPYMAPERFGDEHSTGAVDVYALTCVLYEALTGNVPFPGQTSQIIAAHLSTPPPRPSAVDPDIPAALDDVIDRGMAKHPDDRYGSAGALARAAKRALTRGTSTRPKPPPRDADSTMMASEWSAGPSGPSSYPPFNAQPSHPGFNSAPSYPPFEAQQPQYPPPAAQYVDQGERSKSFAVPAIIVVAVVAVVVAIGVLIGVLAQGSSSDNASPSTYTTTAGYSYPSSSAYTTPAYATTTVAQDPAVQLASLAAQDRPVVSAQLADRWVPQVSSKRPGIVDNGVTWDNAMTLQEHQRLRQQYSNVRLLWSGDWSTFDGRDFWVTVVGIAYDNAAGALQWCTANGFDNKHCAAKIVSTTHPVSGSTAYNS